MKELKINKIVVADADAAAVPALLDRENVDFQSVDVANWEEYPYRPEVSFRIAYTADALLLNYRVKEATARARYGNDNEAVWTDSCVEFFVIPGEDGIYYNFECNCIGTLLLGVGQGKQDREHAPADVMRQVKRWSSLGDRPFEERMEETAWEVALIIPYTAFFKHSIRSLEGRKVRANFYKCGDELQTPHFLSWNPIGLPAPNFHCPDFFGLLSFE